MSIDTKIAQRSNRIVWVESLGVLNFFPLFIETFLFGSSVRYDEKNISFNAAQLLGFLRKHGLCKNFYMAKLTLDKKDAQGYAFTYRKEKDFDNCLNNFCQRYIPIETERFKSMVKTYMSLYLNHAITFVTMVEGTDEFKESGGVNVLCIARQPLISVIKEYYKEKGFIVKESGLSLSYIKYFLRPLYQFFTSMMQKFLPKKTRTNIRDSKPAVWIEYYHNSIGFPFYLDAIDRNKFDIVCYLDRNDGVSLGDEINAIEKIDLKWIDLRSSFLGGFSNITVSQLWGMLLTFFFGNRGFPLWFRVFQSEYRMKYLLYRALFSRFKVKMLLQHQDWSWVQEVQIKALEDAGGIMLGYHWSNCIFYKQAVYLTPQHVYFVWGKIMYEYLRKRENIIRHVLPAGIWFGPAQEHKSAICLKDGLKFIIAIFDSSVAYNAHQSEETLARFYLKLLEVLEKNPEWGGIIKSKNWSRIDDLEFLPHGKEIFARASLLIEQKRLIFLNNKVSPVTAAAYANISACYGLNSAGIISGIYGHRVIHWDSSGWLHYLLYKDPSQKVIFQDLEEMVKALIKASEGDTEVGDFSKWKEDYNYFNDFDGRSRISDFIRFFMEDVVVRKDPIKSLDLAADRYKKTNNIGDAFFKDNGLWGNE